MTNKKYFIDTYTVKNCAIKLLSHKKKLKYVQMQQQVLSKE